MPTKRLLFIAALLPALYLAAALMGGGLGANPAEALQLGTGIWALRFLILSLAVTPVRRIAKWNGVIQYRRMLGLFAFFYAFLHLLTYLVLDRSFDFAGVWEDVVTRPYITAGMVAFVAMVPLAVTSTKGWIRRLGRKWQVLHRLVYLSAIAAAVHYLWKVKVMTGAPVIYAVIVAGLLAVRLSFLSGRGGTVRKPL
ncbi:sulfoxide reductase heme-binding subunit YedZ [soil metagenome]